jgi:hypothetical protein
MKYYSNPSDKQVYGYDPENQQDLIDAAIAAGWTNVTTSWPPAPSDDALKAECAATAKQLLVQTDFSQLGDVNLTNKSEFDAYRATVRALVLNPVVNPIWPTQPKAVWA